MNGPAPAPVPAHADPLALHEALLRVRHAEEVLAARYREQEMRTPAHFGSGQEAVAVGVCMALRPDDVITSHHRCHNHYLAKGGDLYELAAELYGRADGCSRGRGGSVHLTAPHLGITVTSAILGEAPTVAAGAALAFAMDGVDRVAVTFFGEGAMDEGALYETLNYAAIKSLPVLFVCENNLYATETPLWVHQAPGTDLCERARSFKVEACRVDGNDVAQVHALTRDIVARIRGGGGPFFLEAMTYRWREHAGPLIDHEVGRAYRSKEEFDSWMDRCPVKRSASALVAAGLATQDQLDALDRSIRDVTAQTIERARSAPWPATSTLFDHV